VNQLTTIYKYNYQLLAIMPPKRVAVTLPDEAREFLEQEAKDTGVPISNLVSYIVANYVRDEKKKRQP
jgi:hypothetical protein